jgi:cytochrome P450
MKKEKEEKDFLASKGLLAKLMASRGDDRKERLNDDEIIDNVLTILFAGSDTTASVTMSVWKVLSENPHLKSYLQTATDEQVERFVMLVMESYPPAPFSVRRNMQDDVQVGKYRIPANWLVVYGFAGVLLSRTQQRNTWDLPGNEPTDSKLSRSTINRANWLPYGTGPRQCPGRFLANMELKIITKKLATLQWELESGQNLSQRYTPGYFPVDGFKVKFIAPHSS